MKVASRERIEVTAQLGGIIDLNLVSIRVIVEVVTKDVASAAFDCAD